MMNFDEEELKQVNHCLRETIINLTTKLVTQTDEIADLKQHLACANKFFDKVSVHELANITRKDSGL